MILEHIHSPQDVKRLSKEDLPLLAKEIRQFLIEKLSITGGHLSPNLGVVELTLMLHRLFDSPKDKILWDVGHQSYIHKIITGRKEKFDTLRQYKGLSGFPRREESEHDVWETGHSSTSLSAAMGMAIARDLQGKDHHIIAVIGDGAMTGGMALEALNHIGHEQRRLIVILNDNEMSISQNVGAIHQYLGRIRTAAKYQKAKDEMENLLKRIPAIGEGLLRTAERMKDSLKHLLVPGVLFEELGFTYLGPVNGHDFDDLEISIKQAKKLNGPVLLHVITKKGKGYVAAEADSDTWHGLGPYKVESGEVIKQPGPPSYSSIFAKTLIRLAEKDRRIIAITPAMMSGSGLKPFAERFPDRLFDVGIAEQHATTLSAGLAVSGMKPVLSIYSTFLQRAYDQVIHDVCKQNLNVVIAIDRAGLVGADGETHQGVFDIPFLRVVPNLILMMPKDENELQHMIYTALHYEKGPIAFRYPRGNGIGVPLDKDFHEIPIGKWEILNPGADGVILAVGPMVHVAKEVSARFEKEGIGIRVVNARFIKPLDEEMLFSMAQEHLPILTLEESCRYGGFGSAVLEYYVDHALAPHVVNMGIPDRFIGHGSVNQLLEELNLNVQGVMERMREILGVKRKYRRISWERSV
ncbi:1-deoxyxylulose-5-phosphate synthase [[Clostridium] ultunense Esp]|uniref:1-deoxy-D-xylulose-5-phosphate synthase n=1 Tax=Thermicanus aegyptius TaxID=94009 RepID=UPI0002B70AC0|nr:1-deoxy-D-xylulose-5-phosphate synthase [Thermicanus aegyptius]CCQ94486.1 1-deoxyxylulose-5-phosphate synthase [[Clostridium] ultunense Esp]